MTDRLLILAAAAALVGLWVWWRRRSRRRLAVVPADLGPFPAVLFFGSESCASCRPVVEALGRNTIDFRQFTWERDQEVFERLPIDEVPRIVGVDERGLVVVDLTDVPSPAVLARLRRLAR